VRLRNINHGAWLLVTPGLPQCILARRRQRDSALRHIARSEPRRIREAFDWTLGCLSQLRRCGRVEPVKAV
jgi:hypothetical protein